MRASETDPTAHDPLWTLTHRMRDDVKTIRRGFGDASMRAFWSDCGVEVTMFQLQSVQPFPDLLLVHPILPDMPC